MAYSSTPNTLDQAYFLIVGSGNELLGDDAAGLQIADRVADWGLPSVKAISTPRLTAELVNDIAMAHYVIFVEAFRAPNQSRTVQLCPLVLGQASPLGTSESSQATCSDHPLALLSLTELLYGRSPLAWWLQIPTESFDCREKLSMTTEQGCDRALRTIGQFLKTYQQPAKVGQYISAQRHQRSDYQRQEASSKTRVLAPITVT